MKKRMLPWIWPVMFIVLLAGLACLAQSRPACPPVIAQLMPKNSAQASGDYQAMGFVGRGFGVAKLPYQQRCPCLKDDKYRAKVSIELQHYEGEGLQLFQMQIEGVEEQTIQNALGEFKGQQPKPAPTNAVHPTRKETVPGGTLVLYDYQRACPGDCVPDKANPDDFRIPVVQLLGVSHTDASSVVVKIEGDLPVDLAKEAAQEIFANLKKARFDH